MNRFEATLDYLYNRLPMFQRIGPAAYKHSLDNTIRLDDLYGHPHRNYSTLHIAGTNGKGSVSHMLASVMQASGYKTGLYTSPHLVDFRERIRVNGKMIPKKEVISWVSNFRKLNRTARIEPSFFELTAALAFDYFAKSKVDIAVIETGLGGRLDSTNIINPEVSIITNISYDHVSLLGNTLEKIAFEKAGIIKPEVPVVISQLQPEVADVFLRKAGEVGASLSFASEEYQAAYGLMDTERKQVFQFSRNGTLQYPDLKTDLPGMYQRLNIPAVLKTVEIMREKGWKISDRALYKGLSSVTASTGLRGRWEIIGNNPLVICDTGHNEDGIRQVTAQLQQTPYRSLHFILGTVSDKDPNGVLALLPADAIYYFTKANIPRALNEDILMEKASAFGLQGNSYPTVTEAYRAAMVAAGTQDLVFIGGSNFVVAEILATCE